MNKFSVSGIGEFSIEKEEDADRVLCWRCETGPKKRRTSYVVYPNEKNLPQLDPDLIRKRIDSINESLYPVLNNQKDNVASLIADYGGDINSIPELFDKTNIWPLCIKIYDSEKTEAICFPSFYPDCNLVVIIDTKSTLHNMYLLINIRA